MNRRHTGHEYTRSHIRTTQLKNAFVTRCSDSMVHSLFLIALFHTHLSFRYRQKTLSFFPSPTSHLDCVAVTAGVRRIDGPLQVKYWGVWTPVTPCGIDTYEDTSDFTAVLTERRQRDTSSTDVFTSLLTLQV